MEVGFFLAAGATALAAAAAAMRSLQRGSLLFRIASAMRSLRRFAIIFKLAMGVTVESAALGLLWLNDTVVSRLQWDLV